jgi:hypothetical protein
VPKKHPQQTGKHPQNAPKNKSETELHERTGEQDALIIGDCAKMHRTRAGMAGWASQNEQPAAS